jgi:hypothetical protein
LSLPTGKHAVDLFETMDIACLIDRMLTQHPAIAYHG